MYGNIHMGMQNWLPILARDYQTFGKTGTTDWGDSGLEYGIPQAAGKDKWMVAETSQYTTAVWVGWEKAVEGGDTWYNQQRDWMNTTGHICSEVLDAIEASNGKPADYAKPDGVESITHIAGIFPYVAPTANTPSKYISTGLVKSEFAKLGTYTSTVSPLSNLASFNATLNTDGSISFSWTPYPDSSKLTIASSSSVAFDPSWISGPVVYKVRLSQNGTTVKELTSSSENSTQTATLAYNTETQACGYYGYQNTTDESNEVCVTFKTGEDPSTPTTKTGTFKSYSGTTIKLDDGTQVDFTGITITKNGAAVEASTLKAGDALTITYVNGKVSAIAVS
jgi:penicillin-binding protein 1A